MSLCMSSRSSIPAHLHMLEWQVNCRLWNVLRCMLHPLVPLQMASALQLPRRERNDGLYRVITYLCYKMLEELIVAIIISVIAACIVFYGVQLKGQWVAFWLTYLVTLANGIGMQLHAHLPLVSCYRPHHCTCKLV